MITSTKSILKKKKDRTLGQMVNESYTDKITQRSIHIHSHKKRKREKKYVCIYKKKKNRKRATKSINKSTNDNKL